MSGIRQAVDTKTARNCFLIALWLCGALAAAGCAALGSRTPTYNVSSNAASSQVTVENTEDGATVEVFSDTGIGGATVTLTDGSWPHSLVLRFHLRGLEDLGFAYEETAVQLSVNTQQQVLQSVTSGGSSEENIDESSPYWMPVRFLDNNGAVVTEPVSGGVIEVTAPAAFTSSDAPEFTINWIDFYR